MPQASSFGLARMPGGRPARHANSFNYVAGQPTRRRRAGGETLDERRLRRRSAVVGGVTLSGGARIDQWQISDGHLSEQTIATAR